MDAVLSLADEVGHPPPVLLLHVHRARGDIGSLAVSFPVFQQRLAEIPAADEVALRGDRLLGRIRGRHPGAQAGAHDHGALLGVHELGLTLGDGNVRAFWGDGEGVAAFLKESPTVGGADPHFQGALLAAVGEEANAPLVEGETHAIGLIASSETGLLDAHQLQSGARIEVDGPQLIWALWVRGQPQDALGALAGGDQLAALGDLILGRGDGDGLASLGRVEEHRAHSGLKAGGHGHRRIVDHVAHGEGNAHRENDEEGEGGE